VQMEGASRVCSRRALGTKEIGGTPLHMLTNAAIVTTK